MSPGTAGLAVACLAVAALWLRLLHAGDPIGGFHAFNEAWYALITSNYTDLKSLLFPFAEGRVDYNVPPLFSWLLYVSTRVFGQNEWAMRLVPVLFGAGSVPLVYALGARFFGRNAGVAAAAFFAFAPVSMIVGRNIQTDGVHVFVLLAALLMYLRARDAAPERRTRAMAAAGLLFGVAFMTKQFAVLLLPAVFLWEIITTRGLRWFGRGRVAFGLAALLPALPFYGYHLLRNGAGVFGAQSGILESQTVQLSGYDFSLLLTEYWWGLSPGVAVLCVAGLAYCVWRRGPGGWLVLCATAVFNLFFIRWHGHSYYMMFCVPYLCVAGGAVVAALPWPRLCVALAAVVSASALVLAMAMLCTLKYGCNEYALLMQAANEQKNKPMVVAAPEIYGSYHPVLYYYGRGLDVRDEAKEAARAGAFLDVPGGMPVFLVGAGQQDHLRYPRAQIMIRRTNYELVLFGYKIVPHVRNEHFFYVERLQVARARGGPAFGIMDAGLKDALVVGWVPPGGRVPVRRGMVDFGAAARRP